MNQEEVIFRSYLLRLWRVKQNGDWGWRASLEEAGTGQQRAFTNLDALFSYLAAVSAEAETGAAVSEQEESEL